MICFNIPIKKIIIIFVIVFPTSLHSMNQESYDTITTITDTEIVSTPEYNGAIIEYLESSVKLKFLDKESGKYFFIETPSGKRGWVYIFDVTTPKSHIEETKMKEAFYFGPNTNLKTNRNNVVTANWWAYVYKTPDQNSDTVTRFEKGETLFFLKRYNDNVIYVETINGKRGFVSKEDVSKPPFKIEAEKKREIEKIEAKVRPLPSKDVIGNLTLYKKLLHLDPDNKRYQNKVAYYKSKIPPDKITGAFGKFLGEEFDPAKSRISYTYADGIPLYEFRPEKPFQSFSDYCVRITPKGNKICTIFGIGKMENLPKCKKERDFIYSILTDKYKDDLESTKIVKDLYDTSARLHGAKLINQGDRSILIKCVGNYSDDVKLEIRYYDDTLLKIAEKEHLNAKKSSSDASGL